ncbi:MAG: hypothetical protein QOK42_833 [Frankiaceae bacterium]|jgi:hypothetical protein|nr:hypothetical protein [Frankiaceae bacterium]
MRRSSHTPGGPARRVSDPGRRPGHAVLAPCWEDSLVPSLLLLIARLHVDLQRTASAVCPLA